MSTTTVVDEAERERIERTGLHETLFVEAGAGTGKTHELVERVLHLVLDAEVPLARIAAITFTEAAAAELRDRIREAIERRLADDPSPAVEARCNDALDQVDEAAIGTLHGFCRRILGEHPLEVGLPPRIDIQDEVSSQLAFHERWHRFVDGLHADPATVDLVLRSWALGIRIERSTGSASIEDVAAIFDDTWDRLDAVADDPPPPLAPIDLGPVRAATDDLRAIAATCTDDTDKLLAVITGRLLPEAEEVLAEHDPIRQLKLLAARREGWKPGSGGSAKWWPDKDAAKAAVHALGEAGGSVCRRATDETLRHLTHRLARFTRDAAEERRAQGHLDFHDLLVLARRLVRTSAAARAALHERYHRLLLDEFQDTDPIQIEVAVLIAAAVEGTAGEWADGSPAWDAVQPEAGRLFFVGDPKQSIYRFRRADIGLFLRARDAFAGDRPVTLRQNFRTVEPILEWVNHVFGQLMVDEVPGAQAHYQPLSAHRRDAPGDHRVVLLGGARHDVRAGPLRDEEATAVASAIAEIRDDPGAWTVFDAVAKSWRAPTMRDITILVPTRTSLRHLEDALEAQRVPYRVATGTLVYDTQEVRETIDALRAVDDPGDALALVSALRSPLYACSDVDLFTYHQAGGAWDVRRDPPRGLAPGHPVVRAMAHLRSLWRVRWWHEPSELLERLLRERQAFALGFSHRRPRESWRRLHFLVEQARAFEEAGGGGLRAFLDWAELQRTEGSRAHEMLQAETDDDAVSILTIHGAKGLEFPITIVSGMTTQAGRRRTGVEVHWDGDRPEVRLRKSVATEHFDRLADIEAEMDVYERRRLLYVACTRARDHLIVSTFHPAPKGKQGDSFGQWVAELSADVEGASCRRLAAAVPADVAPGPGVALDAVVLDAEVTDRASWVAAREALLAEQRAPRFRSATSLAAEISEAAQLTLDIFEDDAVAGAADDGLDVDVDDPFADASDGGASAGEAGAAMARPAIPWRRGRAGTAIGRAVHATLQFVSDADDLLVDDLATQHAYLEAVPDAADTIAALARSALRAPSVRAAHAAPRQWRELYVAAPVGDRAIEGYIDLLYETDDGLVLVDYKTDAVNSAAAADAKAARYGIQTAAYALALEASTGLRVVEARLVFCTTGDAIERVIPDLDAAKQQVGRHLAPR